MRKDGNALVRLDGREWLAALNDPALPAEVSALMRETMRQMPWLAKA